MFGVETGVRGSPPGRDPERIGVTAVQNRFVKQVLRQSLPRPLSRISSFLQQRTPNIISQKKFSYLFYIIQFTLFRKLIVMLTVPFPFAESSPFLHLFRAFSLVLHTMFVVYVVHH